jgi:hypothetical protein
MHARILLSLLLPCGLLLAGCGDQPALGTVRGRVTLDNEPLEGAVVTFQPQRGAPSLGVTDADGRYTLQFSRAEAGALVDKHTVDIRTFREANPDADPPEPRSPERVPLKYNTETQLIVDVVAGENTHDFPLTSDGPIVQPDELVEVE